MADNNPFPILPQFQGDYLDAQRKMALAQALQQQALSPPEGTEGWNSMRIVPRLSPLNGLAKVGQALLANQTMGSAIDAQRQLGQNQWGAIQSMFQPQQQTSYSGGYAPSGNLPQQQTTTTASPMNPGNLPTSMAALQYMRDPAKYTEQFVAPYYKPTEQTMLGRQAGLDQQQLAQANLGGLAKANYIAPSEARPGGFTWMPDGKGGFTRIFNPNIPQGGAPVTDAQGNIVGATVMPGATGVEQQMALAKGLGAAGAKPIAGYDAQGNPVFTNEAAAATGGANASPSGMFSGYNAPSGGQVSPSLPVGSPELIKGYVERHQQALDAARNAPADIQAFKQIDQAASQAKTGVAFDRGAYWKSFASVIPGVSPDNPDKVNADIIQKYSEQVATRNGGRSDAALDAALHSITNSGMAPASIHELTPSLVGLRMADLGRAQAANQWMKQNGGPKSLGDFEQKWNTSYDPDVYRMQAMNPAQQAAFVNSMSKDQAARLLQHRQSLREMGALNVGQ